MNREELDKLETKGDVLVKELDELIYDLDKYLNEPRSVSLHKVKEAIDHVKSLIYTVKETEKFYSATNLDKILQDSKNYKIKLVDEFVTFKSYIRRIPICLNQFNDALVSFSNAPLSDNSTYDIKLRSAKLEFIKNADLVKIDWKIVKLNIDEIKHIKGYEYGKDNQRCL